MKELPVRNVNEALPLAIQLMMGIREKGLQGSRAGEVIEYPEPVCTTYYNPMERVLFEPVRNANPFFHLFEALWMLAGRDDVKLLSYFNKRMEEFSDNGVTFHAPYGYRLTTGNGSHGRNCNQVWEVIQLLRECPETRRAVLTIWDPLSDLNVDSKDIPCNDMIFLKIRNGKLNMTVCCRSNDVIWGAYGANVVQFSMLQEYIASMVGVQVGMYRQISDSFHVYIDNPQWNALTDLNIATTIDPYKGVVHTAPLIDNPDTWYEELYKMLDLVDETISEDWTPETIPFSNSFFSVVAEPMLLAWYHHKNRNYRKAIHELSNPDGYGIDWKVAGRKWLERTEEKFNSKGDHNE